MRREGVTRGKVHSLSSGRERNVGGSIWLAIFRREGPVGGSGEGASRAVYTGPKVNTKKYNCK